MPNKTRLKEQSSPEPINAPNNNKHIKIIYIYIYTFLQEEFYSKKNPTKKYSVHKLYT